MEVAGESEHAAADSEANYGGALEVESIQNEEGMIDKGKPDNCRTMMQSYEIPFHKPKEKKQNPAWLSNRRNKSPTLFSFLFYTWNSELWLLISRAERYKQTAVK